MNERIDNSENYSEYDSWGELSKEIESQFEKNGNVILLDSDGNADLVPLKEILNESKEMILMRLNREPILSHILLNKNVEGDLPKSRLINDIAAAYIITTLKDIIEKSGININDYIK